MYRFFIAFTMFALVGIEISTHQYYLLKTAGESEGEFHTVGVMRVTETEQGPIFDALTTLPSTSNGNLRDPGIGSVLALGPNRKTLVFNQTSEENVYSIFNLNTGFFEDYGQIRCKMNWDREAY